MSWLKRNLFLVVGGVVALALLGGAGYFLWSEKTQADSVTGELQALIDDLTRLTSRDPFPNDANIEAVKVDQKRLATLLEDIRRHFVPTSAYTNIDSETFKGLLENTIAELEKSAERAGVKLPEKYDFTFKPERTTTVFDAPDLLPLASELADIRAICDVLFRARVHLLSGIRRVPVGKLDQGAADFLTVVKARTNGVVNAVIRPYEFTFQGFSGELANVLDGFGRSPYCLIVKNVNVEPVSASTTTEGGETSTPGAYLQSSAGAGVPTAPLSAAERFARRYGRSAMGPGSRYPGFRGPAATAPVTPAPVAVAPVRRGPETVLDEKPLKITMLIESVRMPLGTR